MKMKQFLVAAAVATGLSVGCAPLAYADDLTVPSGSDESTQTPDTPGSPELDPVVPPIDPQPEPETPDTPDTPAVPDPVIPTPDPEPEVVVPTSPANPTDTRKPMIATPVSRDGQTGTGASVQKVASRSVSSVRSARQLARTGASINDLVPLSLAMSGAGIGAVCGARRMLAA